MMIQRIGYGDKLDYYVQHDNLIPYRLHRFSRYRTNCFYWIEYDQKWFKVDEVEYDFDTSIPTLNFVQVTWMDDLQGYLCTDLTINDFRLEKDKYNIRKREIINSMLSFSGGEIEFWFFKNKVNFMEKKYAEFAKYFDPKVKKKLDSSKYYFIKADQDKNGNYINVKFILDPTNEKFYKPLNRESVVNDEYTVTISKKDIDKEKRRRKNEFENKRIEEQIGIISTDRQ